MEIGNNKTRDPMYWKNRAKQGAEFFESRSVGRPMNIESPAQLWKLACEYFESCEATPWNKKVFVGKEGNEEAVPTASPFLWSGLEDFLFEKIGVSTLKDYRTAARKENVETDETYARYAKFSEVIRAIDNVMLTQKLSGALVGAFNSNLVARLEGLVDKSEETVVVKDETKIGFE